MPKKPFVTFTFLDGEDKLPEELDDVSELATTDFGALLAKEVTQSGSFDLRGFEFSSFGQLLNALPIAAFLLDLTHGIIFANDACMRIGVQPENIYGAPFASLFQKARTAALVDGYINKVITRNKPRVVEALIGVDDHKMWGRIHIRNLRKGRQRMVLVLVEDVSPEKHRIALVQEHQRELQRAHEALEQKVTERTAELREANQKLRKEVKERQKAEQAVRKSEEKFFRAFDSSPDSIMMARLQDGVIVDLNATFARTFGHTQDEILGWPVAALDLWANSQDRQRYLSTLLDTGECLGLETDLRDSHGNAIPSLVSGRIIELEGRSVVISSIQDLTELQRAQQALAESEERYRKLVDLSPNAIFVVANDAIAFANRAAADLLNLTVDELLGRDLIDFVHADYKGMLQRRLHMVLHHGMAAPLMEELFVRPDGTVVPVEEASVLLTHEGEKGVQVVVHDISLRKRIEAALRDRDEKLRLIADGLPVCISYIDANRRYRFNNKTYESWFGLPVAEMRGRHVRDVLGRDLYEQVAPWINEVLAGRQVTYDISIERPDGTIREAQVLHVPHVGELGQVKGYASLTTDVTEQKKMEEILISSERHRAIADLATGVAHNFNNILQVVMGEAELAASALDLAETEAAREHLEGILASSQLASQTVKHLQSFAGLRMQARQAESKLHDLSAIVQQAVAVSEAYWRGISDREDRSIDVRTDLAHGCTVMGDESEIIEVVLCLIKNSVEALPDGGEIQLTTRVAEERVVLTCRDNGVGIAHELLGRVFEPFFTTKGFQRVGMGLATSLGTIGRMDGTIAIDSIPGSGTTVTVNVPVAYASDLPGGSDTPSVIDPPNQRLLVVDDVELVRNMVKEGLSEFGYSVFTAGSGDEAISILAQSDFDVIISDLGMPDTNGWQLGKHVREVAERQGVPKPGFILLTGWGGQIGDEKLIAESGVDLIVEKPASVDRLLKAIEGLRQTSGPAGSGN